MPEIIKSCREKWELWRDKPRQYTDYLINLERDLNFGDKFQSYAPICLQGDWNDTKDKILVFSLNPSAKSGNKYYDWEEEVRGYKHSETERRGLKWGDQEKFMKNYFNILSREGKSLSFFTRLGHVLSKIDHEHRLEERELYRYLQKRIINIDLLPFYSKNFKIKNMKNLGRMRPFWRRTLDFIRHSEFSSFWLNGFKYRPFLKGKGKICGEAGRAKTRMYPISIITLEEKKGILSCFSNQINFGKDQLVQCLKSTIDYNQEKVKRVL